MAINSIKNQNILQKKLHIQHFIQNPKKNFFKLFSQTNSQSQIFFEKNKISNSKIIIFVFAKKPSIK